MTDPTKILQFANALWKFVRHGHGRFLPDDKIKERLEICITCPQFTGSKCRVCGCGAGRGKKLLNKLALPTESCPDSPSRWGPET